MPVNWDRHNEILKLLQNLKGEIAERWASSKDKDAFLRGLLLYLAERYPRSRAETEQIAVALASFFEDHPEAWETSAQNSSGDPPGLFKSFKDKLENLLDVLRKFLP